MSTQCFQEYLCPHENDFHVLFYGWEDKILRKNIAFQNYPYTKILVKAIAK